MFVRVTQCNVNWIVFSVCICIEHGSLIMPAPHQHQHPHYPATSLAAIIKLVCDMVERL